MGTATMLAALLATLLAALLAPLLTACASAGIPPGGPVDKAPPVLVKVTPDTGTLHATAREVVFRFDEVVSERPRSAASLDQIVVVSPSDGPMVVNWHRQTIAIRPRKGFRANTAYSITILAGLTDLRGNALAQAVHTEFSTGDAIPHGTVRGIAFDWVAQKVAAGARIEATRGADTVLRYIAAADSAGRFTLGSLPSGDWRVRVFLDPNTNRVLDANEMWDSVTLSVADSARRDFYLFLHDSIGPRASSLTVEDSVTLRVRFDRPILPSAPLDSSHFVVWRKTDSLLARVRRVVTGAQYDSGSMRRKRASADSAARADTSAAGRRALARADSARAAAARDSVSKAQDVAIRAARDTVKRDSLPKPSRPAPNAEYVVELAAPLVQLEPMRLQVRNATGLAHGVRPSSIQEFLLPKPKPPAPKDSSATAPAVKKP